MKIRYFFTVEKYQFYSHLICIEFTACDKINMDEPRMRSFDCLRFDFFELWVFIINIHVIMKFVAEIIWKNSLREATNN